MPCTPGSGERGRVGERGGRQDQAMRWQVKWRDAPCVCVCGESEVWALPFLLCLLSPHIFIPPRVFLPHPCRMADVVKAALWALRQLSNSDTVKKMLAENNCIEEVKKRLGWGAGRENEAMGAA